MSKSLDPSVELDMGRQKRGKKIEKERRHKDKKNEKRKNGGKERKR